MINELIQIIDDILENSRERGIILKGNPGSGKTYTLKKIASYYSAKIPYVFVPGLHPSLREKVLQEIEMPLRNFSTGTCNRLLIFDEFDDQTNLRKILSLRRKGDIIIVSTNIRIIYRYLPAYFTILEIQPASLNEMAQILLNEFKIQRPECETDKAILSVIYDEVNGNPRKAIDLISKVLAINPQKDNTEKWQVEYACP